MFGNIALEYVIKVKKKIIEVTRARTGKRLRLLLRCELDRVFVVSYSKLKWPSKQTKRCFSSPPAPFFLAASISFSTIIIIFSIGNKKQLALILPCAQFSSIEHKENSK